jgi:hypothetical protein
MAICPRCLGPLTEVHRCPRGRLAPITDVGSTLLVGGIVGVVVCFALAEGPTTIAIVIAATLGAILAQALRQAVGPRS